MYYQINGKSYIVARTYDSERPSLNGWGRNSIMLSILKGDEYRIDYPVLSYIKNIKRIDDHTVTRWVFDFINPAEALMYLNEAGLIKIKPVQKFPTGANIVVINDDNIIMDDK